MARKLTVLFDGTWNTPKGRTAGNFGTSVRLTYPSVTRTRTSQSKE